ncbi:AAA family ATPase [Cetobacterium somerae]|uniref:AAA family ATPase n=1 Tax=Cetobacterium somerae TaxID=188913 RepID=UPI002E7BFFE6|nr:AAA family ATPase [Cetobacterium somerae]WVJ02150.1 AAA family ATPase [Cetobacterium somerae]
MNFYDVLQKDIVELKKNSKELEVNLEEMNELENLINQEKAMLDKNYDEYIEKIPLLKEKIYLLEGKNIFPQAYYVLNESNLKDQILNKIKFINELKKISLILKMTKGDKKIILIGGNGSGKSSLADYLKQSLLLNVIVFPAQKHLFLENDYEISYTKDRVQAFQHQRQAKANIRDTEKSLIRNIRAIANNHIDIVYTADKLSMKEREKTLFDKFKNIFEELIPEIEMSIDTNYRTIYPSKNEKKYSFDQMSEGEKVIAMYISELLLAKENSYIIVDEPESHLNIATINKLWDLLCDERNDCKFIFISHNIDFINSRGDIHLVWCKSFTHPNEWVLEEILDTQDIPVDLITEIVGSKKPIIFCEGKKNSLDYRVYSSLFMKTHTIYPVENHRDVINYTKAYEKISIFKNQRAYGIVDGDLTEDQNVEELRKAQIVVLPFNEIEMFLLDENIIVEVLSLSYSPEEIKEKILKFKEDFFNKIKNSKEKIILSKLKKEIDSRLEKEKVQEFSTLEELNISFKKIVNLQLDDLNKKYMEKLESKINEKDYPELLKWCSLKGEVSKNLANRHLEEKYIDKAIFRLTQNEELKKKLQNKYFKDLYLTNEEK